MALMARQSNTNDSPLDYRQQGEYCVDNHRERRIKPIDLVQGTLDLLILKSLQLEPQHGWAIARRIKQMSSDILQVHQGSLYPALHRLEHQGWIAATWGVSEQNRRAKYYALTRAGRRQLEKEAASWERLAGAITQVVRSES
jgi:PadR family transcriptional regulator PadR